MPRRSVTFFGIGQMSSSLSHGFKDVVKLENDNRFHNSLGCERGGRGFLFGRFLLPPFRNRNSNPVRWVRRHHDGNCRLTTRCGQTSKVSRQTWRVLSKSLGVLSTCPFFLFFLFFFRKPHCYAKPFQRPVLRILHARRADPLAICSTHIVLGPGA